MNREILLAKAWIVIVGDPVYGFHYFGPFTDYNEAVELGDNVAGGGDWWIAELKEPDSE